MANRGKHSRSPLTDWLAGEDGTMPTKSRGAHVVDLYVKKGKATVKKFRPRGAPAAEAKPEAALVRDPALPVKGESKPSPAASWDHLRRMERLPQLRAPYGYKGH